MQQRFRAAAGFLCATALLIAPSIAGAVEVTRSDDGSVRIVGAAAADRVTIARDEAGLLVVADATGSTMTVADALVDVRLGAGNDIVDSRLATGVQLRLDGGAGADRFIVGTDVSTRIVDTTGTDTVDLSRVEGDVRVRWRQSLRRLTATCPECAGRGTVELPARPGAVVLGSGDDDVDLAGWRVRGRTTWNLGAGQDRFFGSPIRRSIVNGGADADELVSWAAVDVLRGGPGTDQIADFGGTGDVLLGGADWDVMASLDGRRDRLDGGAAKDMCPSLTRRATSCDTSGQARSFELVTYLPTTVWKTVLGVVGIRR